MKRSHPAVEPPSEDSDEELAPTSKKKRCYTTEFKLQVIDAAKAGSVHGASSRFRVDRKRIREWIYNERNLHNLKNSSAAGRIASDFREQAGH
uniref:Brinker DNA-binding domain-containing protein n=1 Tax=Ditylenchus dipsaci TaxID=166011 RepID=A0A915CXM0_9BILA